MAFGEPSALTAMKRRSSLRRWPAARAPLAVGSPMRSDPGVSRPDERGRLCTRRAFLSGAAVFAGSTAAIVLASCDVAVSSRRPPAKIARIGFLLTNPISDPIAVDNIEAFRLGLRELGYVEGENIVLELRSAEGQPGRFAELAAELVAMRLDLILSSQPQVVERLRDATSTVPIVFIGVDPAIAGITDHAHPGGNITGIGDTFAAPVNAKRLQLLKEAVPSVARVAVVRNPTGGSATLAEMQDVAPVLGVQIQLIDVRSVEDFDAALASAVAGRADALMVLARVLALPRAMQIAEFALKNRLPSMHSGREFVEAGGLMSYAGNSKAGWRRAATYVDRILKGAYPGDLPVEGSPVVHELVINLCTAERLGITIPASVLVQADVVRCAAR